MAKKRKLFCEYNKLFYQISVVKENLRREFKNVTSGLVFAKEFNPALLPHVAKGHRSVLLRSLLGVDEKYQRNKVHNLKLAAKNIDGLIIRPGQTFSFWKRIGKPTRGKGYLDGLVLAGGKVGHDVGGGICQLANMLYWLVLHSPLQVTELHHHSDSIFPDDRRRVPFGTGTSVFYKNVDLQFCNTTDKDVQLHLFFDDEYINGELRTREPFEYLYKLEEEGHHYAYEGDKLYRNSEVWRLVYDRKTQQQVAKELLLRNHSEVLYDYALVNPAEIVETSEGKLESACF